MQRECEMGVIDSFDVPDDVAGYLEWASGILFVNCTKEEWHEFLAQSEQSWFDRDAMIFNQTITHETYHFYQIATTGYLYRFVSRLFAEVANHIGFPVKETNLNKLIEDLAKPSDTLRDLMAEIDRPGPKGLTVRDIVESAAYLYEFKYHYPAFDALSFKEQIEIENPPKEYRFAFEIAEACLGDSAFDNFLIVSILSLCFDNPTEAFYTALDMVRRTGVIYKRREHMNRLFATSEQISSLHCGLGTAAEVAFESENLEPRQNPIFRQATYALNFNASNLNPLALVADPKVMKEAAVAVIRPVYLRGGAVWIPSEFKKRARDTNLIPDEFKTIARDTNLENTIKALVILGAISLKLTHSVQFSRFRRPLGGANWIHHS